MVNVGVIGLGPQWDCGYRAALDRLRSRIAIRAVYDAVEGRAAQVAAAWNADTADGIRALVERPDVRAVLLLDTAWHRTRPFEFVLASRKPAFLSVWPQIAASRIEQVARQARDESLTLIPALPQRYMPATARLRELIATRIGRPQRVRIRATCSRPSFLTPGHSEPIACEPLLHLFDWSRQVVRTAPASVTAIGEPGDATLQGVRRIEIQFRTPRDGGACHVDLQLEHHEPPAGSASLTAPAAGPKIEIDAERGAAILVDPCTIRWTAGGKTVDESLAAERSEYEVMLDLFCRRVVGGLIPVADFRDLTRGLALWGACEESLRTTGPVALKGRDV